MDWFSWKNQRSLFFDDPVKMNPRKGLVERLRTVARDYLALRFEHVQYNHQYIIIQFYSFSAKKPNKSVGGLTY